MRWANVVRRFLALTLLATSTATGQQRDSTARADSAQRDSTRAFVRGGVNDKPFQTRLLGRTAIGGYAEVHARAERRDGANEGLEFDAKRFNLFTSTRVSSVVSIASEVEIEEGGREIALEYAAIDVRVHPAFTLRGGMLLSPVGRFNLSHDSPLNEFTDRPVVSTEVVGVALSEPGLGAYGWFPAKGGGRFTYELYATNGFHDGVVTSGEGGTRIPQGRGNFEDNNGSPAVVGRLTWSPSVGIELGASVHHGAYNAYRSDGVAVDKRRNATLRVVDGEASVAGIEIRGEFVSASVDIDPGLQGIYAARQRGWYVESTRALGRGWVRTMPGSTFLLKARVDDVDFDADHLGDAVRQLTVGVNFRPTSDSAIKFDFVRGRTWDRFNNRSDHALLLASLATYF